MRREQEDETGSVLGGRWTFTQCICVRGNLCHVFVDAPIEVRESVGFLGAEVTYYCQMSEVGAGCEPGSSRRAASSCKR